MAVYTRQYTQGVGWENEPSVNTPINAENLNQMDNAIKNVDAATASAFAAVEALIRNIDQARFFADTVTSVSGMHLNTSSIFCAVNDFKAGDVLFLHFNVEAEYPSGGSDSWSIYENGSIDTGTIVDRRTGLSSTNFYESIAAGTTFILTRSYPWMVWDLRAIIPPESAGNGARVFSDHITSRDSTNLLTSTAIIGSGDEKEGDIVFLTCDIDAVWPNPPLPIQGWGISFGAYGAGGGGGTIVDYRNGSESTFTPNISSGTILVISKIDSTFWALRALIAPSAGDSSIKTFGCTVSSITAFSNTLSPSNFSFQSADDAPADGDIIICRIEDSGSLTGATTTWGFSYEVDGVTASHTMIDARNGQAIGDFSDGIKAGTVLVLKYVSGYIYVIGSTISSDFTLRTCHGTANGDSIEIAESFRSISGNDIIFVTITADATIHTWYIRYNIGGMYDIAQIYDELNGTPTSPEYRAALTAGDILILTRKYNFMAKIPAGSAGASTLADLTDTDISSPVDGQVLMYNGTEWENADIPVDDALSDSSENPVQNSVVKAALDSKAANTVATTAAVGLVKPDNSTIEVANDGTISVLGGSVITTGDGSWEITGKKAVYTPVDPTGTGSFAIDGEKATFRPAST